MPGRSSYRRALLALRAAGISRRVLGRDEWRKVVRAEAEALAGTVEGGLRLAGRSGSPSFLGIRTVEELRAWQAEQRRRAHPSDVARAEAERKARESAACRVCQGARFVRVTTSPADPRFGRAAPCVCMPLEQRAALAGVPPLYRRLTFDTFPAQLEGKREAFERCSAWNGHDSLVLFGEPGVWGTGKTGLACAMLLLLCEQGEPCRFVRVAELLEEVKARFGEGGESAQAYFARERSEPVLVLDDLGAEVGTGWALQQLATLIDYRTSRRLPTIVTTNLVYSEIAEHLGGAVASRLASWEWVFVGGADLRVGGAR